MKKLRQMLLTNQLEWWSHIGVPHFWHLGFKFFIGYFFFFWLCPEIWNKQILHRCFVSPNRGYSEASTSMLSLRFLPRISETLPRRPIPNQQCVISMNGFTRLITRSQPMSKALILRRGLPCLIAYIVRSLQRIVSNRKKKWTNVHQWVTDLHEYLDIFWSKISVPPLRKS